MVVTEAMACGCPVMATPNGAMPELIKHGESGWLCPRDGDFGKVLFSIQDGVPEEMREQARTQASKFSWQAAAEQYNDLYQKVVNGHSW
jgi:glycosyltransferase involved in cell wall biosynthesis